MLFFGPNVLFTQFWDPFFWVGDKLLLLDFPCFLLREIGLDIPIICIHTFPFPICPLHVFSQFRDLFICVSKWIPSFGLASFFTLLYYGWDPRVISVMHTFPSSDIYALFSSQNIRSYPTLLNVFQLTPPYITTFFWSPGSHWRWFLPQTHLSLYPLGVIPGYPSLNYHIFLEPSQSLTVIFTSDASDDFRFGPITEILVGGRCVSSPVKENLCFVVFNFFL